MQNINREMLQDFRDDFKIAVRELENKYNCKIDLQKITYSDVDFTASLKVVKNIDGKSSQQVEFEKYCEAYGFKNDDFGRRVRSLASNKEFTFVGFVPKARKYRYLIKCSSTGEVYKTDTINFI